MSLSSSISFPLRSFPGSQSRPQALTLAKGVVHEVFADVGGGIGIYAAAGLAISSIPHNREVPTRAAPLVAWIGRRIWPYPGVLWRSGLLGRSLFVSANDARSRLWAVELAMRSGAVAAVVADGSGFSMTATRRLQLIARDHPPLLILPRSPKDTGQSSACGMRWRVTPVPTSDHRPCWRVELTRCKGVHSFASASSLGSYDHQSAWMLLWEGERATTQIFSHPFPSQFIATALPGGSFADMGDRSHSATSVLGGSAFRSMANPPRRAAAE